MNRIYHPYTDWEDFKNGMYDTCLNKDVDELISQSCDLLKDTTLFYEVSLEVLKKWKIASDVNLSNLQQNRKAWVGWAACSYNHKCPEILTRDAWMLLSDLERYKANEVASKIIKIYESKNKPIHQALGKQLLLQWDS